jgi:hypothetical protein
MDMRNIASTDSVGLGIGFDTESSTPSGVFGLSNDRKII